MNNQNENNNSGLPEETPEERKARINRTVYITAVILLISIAIIAGIVSAANRAKKNPVETPPATSEREDPSTRPPSSSIVPPASSESAGTSESGTGTSDPDSSVSSKLPDFTLPVSGTLSVEHDPELQVFSPTMKDYRVHLGVDINTAEGASVVASADGVIEKVWDDPMMGKCVAIAHDGDSATFYKNLSETLAEGIEKGKTVKAGQLIGTVGDSALMEVAQEPHLHFEITVGGLQVDPAEYFSDDVWAELELDEEYEG